MTLLVNITDSNINNIKLNLVLLNYKFTFFKSIEFILLKGFIVYNNFNTQ